MYGNYGAGAARGASSGRTQASLLAADAEVLASHDSAGNVIGSDADKVPSSVELMVSQDLVPGIMTTSKADRFTAVEVSDGSLTVKKSVRKKAISLGCSLGLKVLTEVGKKDPRERMSTNQLIETVYQDLENGAFKVILEGRESGMGSGLYDEEGFFIGQVVKDLEEAVGDINNLIWEAPLKHQQTDLILRFGPNVNMGNIAPNEVFSTESLRLGLRGDTLTAAYFGNP